MDSNLFNAILAMDSYNRGYAASIELSGNEIGIAAITEDSESLGTVIVNGAALRECLTLSLASL